ncbi:hypothetical protein ABTX24_11680 [Nocardioides sp. NPDC127514]|uniref:hypothetical protein n=1 Tax=unclassified Nocardioides TaxID=2615069 RepID=UPI003333E0A8
MTIQGLFGDGKVMGALRVHKDRRLTYSLVGPAAVSMCAVALVGCGQEASTSSHTSTDVLKSSLEQIESTHMKMSMNVGPTPDEAIYVSLDAKATVGDEAPSQARWSFAGMKLGSKVVDVRVPDSDEAYLSYSDYGAEENWIRASNVKELALRDEIARPLDMVEAIARDLDAATYEGDDPSGAMEGPRYLLTLPVGGLGDALAGVAELAEVDLPEVVDAYFWTDDEGDPVSIVFDPEDTVPDFSMRIDFNNNDEDFTVEVPSV